MPVRVVALLLLFVLAPAAARAENPVLSVVRAAIDDYVRPGYAALAASAASLENDQAALCRDPSPASLATARAGFAWVVASHARIEFVRFGPVAQDNRIERLLFHPDPRGLALRQVRAILANEDGSAADPGALPRKSVAVQGLGALEFVLWGDGADTLTSASGDFRCRYGAAIAANVATMAREIAAGWEPNAPIVAALLRPSPDEPRYRSEADSLQEIVGVFIFGFEAIRDLRVAPALGASIGKARPNLLLFRRSGLSRESLAADFAGLRALFERSGLAELLGRDQEWVGVSADFEFANAERTLARLPALNEAVAASDGRDLISYLVVLTQNLQALFADGLAPALGLSAGFSALDGD